jgi:hypothetical protein
MPISDADKKVLLQRLELARVAKQKKAAEAKAAKEVKPAPAPIPVEEKPAPAPAPAPEPELPPASDPIDIPAVPDLVAASRKKAKKVVMPDTDSDSEEIVLPKKKKAVATAKKDTPYLKIKLYKEPQDKLAFQNLLQAVAGEAEEEDEDDESVPPPPPQKHYSKGPQVIHRVGATPRGAVVKNITKEDMEAAELRRLALQIFG